MSQPSNVIEGDERKVVRYAERVAQEIAKDCAGVPLDELLVWLRIAHQRESMVTQLYELSQLEARLTRWAPDQLGPAGLVTRDAILSIWAHEESHTRFLASVRSVSMDASWLAEFQGTIEGRVTRSLVDGGLLARCLIAVGSWAGAIPEFATELRGMRIRELLGFFVELEVTAKQGYDRMRSLLEQLDAAHAAERFGVAFAHDVTKILCEEDFHEAAFSLMRGWIEDHGEAFRPISTRECLHALHALCDEHLSVGNLKRRLPRGSRVAKSMEGELAPEHAWISDGGLGALFERHGLPSRVIELAAAD